MLSKITLTKPDIPTVLDITQAAPRSYPAGSRFLLQCSSNNRLLILEGIAVTELDDNPVEMSAGDLVSFAGVSEVVYPIRVIQKLIFCIK